MAENSESNPQDEDEILKELCTVNGINHNRLNTGEGTNVHCLEIFFFGFPKIVGMHHFPNLTSLCIMNQKIYKISGLESCRLLEELWICEGCIEKIEGLQNCTNLCHLHLYANKISHIEGLSTLKKLEKLWLNVNKISAIEGLYELSRLKDLNLAGNIIPTIGHHLDQFTELQVLNLSGNKISSLKDLVNLSSLPKLHTLSLGDPQYLLNPVCRLCNYSSYLLYHLPSLRSLDGKEVSSPELQRLVKNLVSKKKHYYRMKLHRMGQGLHQQCQRIKEMQMVAHNRMWASLRPLHLCIKTLQSDQTSAIEEETAKKISLLKEKVQSLEQQLESLNKSCQRCITGLKRRSGEEASYWMSELESGGNIKFLPGDPSHSWYKSCVELMMSRFSALEMQDLGVTGIQMGGVKRVENRFLYNQFNDKLEKILEQPSYCKALQQRSYKQFLDYLFLVWSPDLDVGRVCQQGLKTPCVALTNSPMSAEGPRLQQAREGGGGTLEVLREAQWGQLVLCKVFMGTSAETTGDSPTQPPGVDCVYKDRGKCNSESQQRDWWVFDHELVLPEYILTFCYTSPLLPGDPLEQVLQQSQQSGPVMADSDTLFSLPSRPKFSQLSESVILQAANVSSLAQVHTLCLHDNRLTKFKLTTPLLALTKLVLSFNELTSMEDIANMPNLEYVDVSFNKLTTLEGMKSLPKLTHLDVSWNSLTSYYGDTTILLKSSPAIEHFSGCYNPWEKMDLYRTVVLGRLKTLKELDGDRVEPGDAANALRQFVSSHLSITTILSHAHTDATPPPSLSLLPTASFLNKESRHRPIQLNSPTNDWCSLVTSVCLCGMGIRHLSAFQHLPNLKWASFADNALVSIEGLETCKKLEELVLDSNLLHTLDFLGNFPELQYLSIAHNHIAHVSIKASSKLTYLNVMDNSISSLSSMKHLQAVTELYLSSNMLDSTRELFHLKSLSQLSVLDISSNPIGQTQQATRLFVIYHLTTLKALDGEAIESDEIAAAKEKLGGRLNQDMVLEQLNNVPFSSLKKMDFPNCSLKHVDLSPVDSFSNLLSLNLESNSLTSFSGLIYLNQLKVLCLNHNRVEVMIRSRDLPSGQPPAEGVLRSLEVLHLAYNGINDLIPLQLNKLVSLKALFLQGNEIVLVEGLDGMKSLTELVLDRNKIKTLENSSLLSLRSLRELHIEENRLKELCNFSSFVNLERLYIGMNRIQDFGEVEKLCDLPQVMELSLISNPVSRRLQHRSFLITTLPSLLSLDGVTITPEERQAAQASLQDQQEELEVVQPPSMAAAVPPQLKVMNIPLGQTQLPMMAQHWKPYETKAVHEKRKARR
ncbi:hypothetical protein EMCRGX_G014321 [Ephydatia muelleri]